MYSYALKRRGFQLGQTATADNYIEPKWSTGLNRPAWESGRPMLLSRFVTQELAENQAHISAARELYKNIIAGEDGDELLARDPYLKRLDEQFDALGSAINEGAEQEIQTLFFDAVDGDKILAEDLWVKISRLSFYAEEQSLRLRFSFGVDFEEDVASDKKRQYFASLLAEAVFPESRIIAENQALSGQLCDVLGVSSVDFVERIIYFNAVDGGAYLHHDRERGHAGVVYAQLTGITYWIALPRCALVNQVTAFIEQAASQNAWPSQLNNEARRHLVKIVKARSTLVAELESFANDALITLINETGEFIRQLIDNGCGQIVHPGDLVVLPQDSEENCCWHSVFCLDDSAGQALSFAIRETTA